MQKVATRTRLNSATEGTSYVHTDVRVKQTPANTSHMETPYMAIYVSAASTLIPTQHLFLCMSGINFTGFAEIHRCEPTNLFNLTR